MTAADTIAKWLGEKGITHAFGIIGGGNVAIWDAIARAQKTKLVAVHHEQAAAMAAAYFYRTSRRLSLCLVTTGAGSTNALTGVMAAWMDSIPVLIVSGNEASHFIEKPHERGFGVQGYDSVAVARPFTKYADRVLVPLRATKLLDYASAIALEHRQGPVWVDVPQDIQRAHV